jgi:FG-GAP repeat
MFSTKKMPQIQRVTCVLAASGMASMASAQVMVPRGMIQAWGVPADASYGHSVASNGSLTAMGSVVDNKVLVSGNKGGLLGGLVPVATLTDPLGRFKGMGYSVSMSGNTLVAGAPYMDPCAPGGGPMSSGVVMVFTLTSDGGASYAQDLRHDGIDRLDNFGCSVAIDGDTVIGGAKYDITTGTSSGAAYVFRRINGVWSQEAKLVAADSAQGDLAGWSVDVSGSLAVVGAPFDSTGPGAMLFGGSVQVFERSGSMWTHTQSIQPPAPKKEGYFGVSVATEGGRILVGETGANKAHVFVKNSAGAWTLQQTMTVPKPPGKAWTTSPYFGAAVDVQGSMVLVGAPMVNSVFRYAPAGGGWALAQTMTPPYASQSGDQFGAALSLANGQAMIGARFADPSGLVTRFQASATAGSGSAGSNATSQVQPK